MNKKQLIVVITIVSWFFYTIYLLAKHSVSSGGLLNIVLFNAILSVVALYTIKKLKTNK